MATNQTNNDASKENLKDEIVDNLHQGILDVQDAPDGVNTIGNDQPKPKEHPAAEPEELPEKKPDVEPEKIPKENPGIQPDTEKGDDEDEDGEPPITQPEIVM